MESNRLIPVGLYEDKPKKLIADEYNPTSEILQPVKNKKITWVEIVRGGKPSS